MNDEEGVRAPGAARRIASPTGAARLLPVAISEKGERMLLHFSAISDVLSTMHGVAPELRDVTRSRLKYFQNRSFPLPGGTRGRTKAAGEPPSARTRGKAKIGMDDALKLAFAFELLEAGMGPTRVIRLVTTDWPVVREILAAAWWRETGGGPSAFDLAIVPRALAEMASQEQLLDTRLSETLGAVARGTSPNIEGRTLLIVDVGRMAVDFGAAATGPKMAKTGEFDRAMLVYCADVFGTEDRSAWRVKLIEAAPAPSAAPFANEADATAPQD